MIGARTIAAALAVVVLAGAPRQARAADELVADISQHLVAITTGFTGADVLLFGATEGAGDVVVVVRGPEERQKVRRKGRVAGIWLNEAEMTFETVPAFYAVAANRPLHEFVPERVGARHQIGLRHLRLTPPEGAHPETVDDFSEGLIRNKQTDRLYSRQPARIAFLGNRLFRTDMHFPANAPVGTYTVQTFLIRDGDVVSAGITPLVVGKVGFEAGVFDLAYCHSLAYGVLAILIAAMAGWLAGLVFRKD